ncbi:hypothetical protein CHLNCDRAFT_145227 [Chlorella variabilis]|uniref:Mannose-P-dolichol utilization defect 1 protein homolog n=1 Tax=Chlorella variabilis TaxID=554065 RepID=E1ZDZ1_CHLVA|nr:hypothetical protein CHLNCDRAFT_145227 [Chlorella variabilis]EFN55940.1 hypothetical protein CHLNCDRAFT_145227 [Chlorella variabilis]|eukprot:XP_005848042.1 hypothetical protein CHLNCDRAFT_145227 [Chlorella variabilis]
MRFLDSGRAICALQNAMIIALIFRMGTVPRAVQLAVSASLAGAAWWLFGGACPPALLTTLQAGSVAVLALGGRLPQILLNVRRGDSGELSLISCGLSLAGNLARIFTTAILVRDPIILGSATTQAMLNGVLTWQCIDTARRLGGSSQAGGGTPAAQPA